MKSSTGAGTSQEWLLGVIPVACSAVAFGFLEVAVYHKQVNVCKMPVVVVWEVLGRRSPPHPEQKQVCAGAKSCRH